MEIIGGIVIAVIVGLGLFLILRYFWLWYWKIDRIVELLENIDNNTKQQSTKKATKKEEITSTHYFVRATANEFNATTNETFYTESISGVKQVIAGLATDPKTYITTVGLYNSNTELLAIAKLSRPILKSTSREALIKVKLDF